jgi:hypothetical protein
VKKELCDILDDIIHYDDSVITDFFLTFYEKIDEENSSGRLERRRGIRFWRRQ